MISARRISPHYVASPLGATLGGAVSRPAPHVVSSHYSSTQRHSTLLPSALLAALLHTSTLLTSTQRNEGENQMIVHLNDIGSEVARDLVLTLKRYDAPLLKYIPGYVKKVTGNRWAPATIRCTLQRHCKQCSQWNEQWDLFNNVVEGCWGLKKGLKIIG